MNDAWAKYVNWPKPKWGQVVADGAPVDEERERELDELLAEHFKEPIKFEMEPEKPAQPAQVGPPAQGWRKAIKGP